MEANNIIIMKYRMYILYEDIRTIRIYHQYMYYQFYVHGTFPSCFFFLEQTKQR